MPAPVDHDARRRDVSAAVWRVLATGGLQGLTLRAVAAEMQASTGLLTHYFPSKRALLDFALDVADERTQGRPMTTPPAPGLPALRAALLDVLPLDRSGRDMNRVWVSSWGAALADAGLTAKQRQRYVRWRGKLGRHVVAAQERGELPAGDPAELAATAAAFVHGLVVQALFDPRRFPPARQIRLLERFLAGLAAG